MQTKVQWWVTAAIVLSGVMPAWAADEPERHPSPTPPQADLIPDLPPIPAPIVTVDDVLRTIDAPPFGPDDKGGRYTDMSVGREISDVLTDQERALLGLARQAIEASRLAGTLQVPGPAERKIPMVLNAEANKLARLQSLIQAEPVVGSGGPHDARLAGPSAEFVGPTQPSDEERAKLEALTTGARTAPANGEGR